MSRQKACCTWSSSSAKSAVYGCHGAEAVDAEAMVSASALEKKTRNENGYGGGVKGQLALIFLVVLPWMLLAGLAISSTTRPSHFINDLTTRLIHWQVAVDGGKAIVFDDDVQEVNLKEKSSGEAEGGREKERHMSGYHSRLTGRHCFSQFCDSGHGGGGDILPNPRPLIGILSQPGLGLHDKEPQGPDDVSYIAASYVKFVEAGGARAVPVIYNAPQEELRRVFNSINGLLYPGGDSDLSNSTFSKVGEWLFNLAIEANDRGDFFPIHGTCQGFEQLAVIVGQQGVDGILESFRHKNVGATLIFTDRSAKRESLFRWMPPCLTDSMASKPLVLMSHSFGVSPRHFHKKSNSSLAKFFRMLTTTVDSEGKPYASTIEAHNYPVTAVQWHPEKNAFEWGTPGVPRGADAIAVTHAAASLFVDRARRSGHRPSSFEEEQGLLIYNDQPVFSGKNNRSIYEQVYWFRPTRTTSVNLQDNSAHIL